MALSPSLQRGDSARSTLLPGVPLRLVAEPVTFPIQFRVLGLMFLGLR